MLQDILYLMWNGILDVLVKIIVVAKKGNCNLDNCSLYESEICDNSL